MALDEPGPRAQPCRSRGLLEPSRPVRAARRAPGSPRRGRSSRRRRRRRRGRRRSRPLPPSLYMTWVTDLPEIVTFGRSSSRRRPPPRSCRRWPGRASEPLTPGTWKAKSWRSEAPASSYAAAISRSAGVLPSLARDAMRAWLDGSRRPRARGAVVPERALAAERHAGDDLRQQRLELQARRGPASRLEGSSVVSAVGDVDAARRAGQRDADGRRGPGGGRAGRGERRVDRPGRLLEVARIEDRSGRRGRRRVHRAGRRRRCSRSTDPPSRRTPRRAPMSGASVAPAARAD